MAGSSVVDFIVDSLGGEYPSAGVDNVAVTCIICGKEDHLWINVNTALCYCHRCGYAANLSKILMDLEGLSYPDALIKSEKLLRGTRRGKSNKVAFDASLAKSLRALILNAQAEHRLPEAPALTLPKYCVPMNHMLARTGRNYLCETRRIPKEKWAPYDLLYAVARDPSAFDIQRHIVFPEYRQGELVYYTTRATFNPEQGPKSRHPHGIKKTTLYGIGKIPEDQRWVVLVEGPMDVLALSGCAVALLGKQITDSQLARLAERFTRVYVCLDKDETKDAWALARELHASGIKTYVTHTPRKDAAESGDLPVEELLDYLLHRAEPYSATGLIKSRL